MHAAIFVLGKFSLNIFIQISKLLVVKNQFFSQKSIFLKNQFFSKINYFSKIKFFLKIKIVVKK